MLWIKKFILIISGYFLIVVALSSLGIDPRLLGYLTGTGMVGALGIWLIACGCRIEPQKKQITEPPKSKPVNTKPIKSSEIQTRASAVQEQLKELQSKL